MLVQTPTCLEKSYTLFSRKQGCWKCNSEARGPAEALGFDSSIQNLSMKRKKKKAEIDYVAKGWEAIGSSGKSFSFALIAP